MPSAERNEVSYYNEIMQFVKAQIESNFSAWEKPLKVYCKTGELRSNHQGKSHYNTRHSRICVKHSSAKFRYFCANYRWCQV